MFGCNFFGSFALAFEFPLPKNPSFSNKCPVLREFCTLIRVYLVKKSLIFEQMPCFEGVLRPHSSFLCQKIPHFRTNALFWGSFVPSFEFPLPKNPSFSNKCPVLREFCALIRVSFAKKSLIFEQMPVNDNNNSLLPKNNYTLDVLLCLHQMNKYVKIHVLFKNKDFEEVDKMTIKNRIIKNNDKIILSVQT